MLNVGTSLVGIAASALIGAGFVSGVALAQDKASAGAASTTVVLENAKVRVIVNTFKPGDVNNAVPSSSPRVVRALKGGTLQRIYADGRTEDIIWKTGEVRYQEPSTVAYKTKNVGKTELQLYLVILK
jgi:hypothetical protein